MRVCPSCNEDEEETPFSAKHTHCKNCNLASYEEFSLGDLIKRFYDPEYPPHIQEYLDKRNKKLGIV